MISMVEMYYDVWRAMWEVEERLCLKMSKVFVHKTSFFIGSIHNLIGIFNARTKLLLLCGSIPPPTLVINYERSLSYPGQLSMMLIP